MGALLLAAIIGCASGEASCTTHTSGNLRLVEVCGITPDWPGQHVWRVMYDGRLHVITLRGQCVDA